VGFFEGGRGEIDISFYGFPSISFGDGLTVEYCGGGGHS